MKYLKATLLGSGALASLLLSSVLTGCQDEDYGYTQEEIHQSYLNRKYAEEFAKAFPNADPNHTWMCAPDTFGVESLIGGSVTRAYPTGMTPSVQKLGTTQEATEQFIKAALDRLPEGVNDNQGSVTQSFDYYAVEDDGTPNDNYAEYTITPTFWGRKFCDANSAGIYWYDNDGVQHDEQIFWHDYTSNGVGSGISVKYTNGAQEELRNTENQINHDITWTNSRHDYPLGKPCTACGVELHAGTNYLKKNDKNGQGQNVSIEDQRGWNCIVLKGANNIQNEWDTQLQVTSPVAWNTGKTIHFKMEYCNDWGYASQTTLKYQLHEGNASGDTYRGTFDTKHTVVPHNNDWEWTTLEFDVTIPKDLSNINKICIDLNPKKSGQDTGFSGEGKTFYIKNVSWRETNCTECGGTGYFPVEKYILPQYLVKIPVGMKWGIYFDTQKQQYRNSSEREWQRYYSNANLNVITDKMEPSNTGKVYAAATYQADAPDGSGPITYCCFEDAATNLHNGSYTGNCECGYGHYDTDYNDFVFTIKGRPVITSYQSLKYRVMCEDLGGTWDWDFNDIVYDVEYADAENGAGNATVKVTLQAVGGTLPVTMQFATAFGSDNIISSTNVPNGNNNTTQDLHKVLDSSNNPDTKGLYTPVNVTRSANQQTVTGKNPQLVCTYTLNAGKYTNFDARRFAELITIKVNQKPLNESGQNTTTTVTFPTAKGDANLIPECFMTSINADWTAENQIITAKYPNFVKWVEDNKSNTHWWDIGIGQ